jgi:phosphoserine phosphatase RsbU/P
MTFRAYSRRSRPSDWIACLAFALAFSSASAQSFDATNLQKPTDLGGIWLVHAGDDPAYARTDFDDSQWTRVDSSANVSSVFPSRPNALWYRLHVKVAPTQTGLGLAERSLSSAFEIYVNGQRIMENGRVAPFANYLPDARLLKPIPDSQVATGSLVIALRVHVSPREWTTTHPGLFTPNLRLGQEHAMWEHIWLIVIGEYEMESITVLAGLGLGIVALALFIAQRRQWEYLWIFLQFFFAACATTATLIAEFHNLPVYWELLGGPLRLLSLCSSVLVYFAILRVRIGWWVRALIAVAVLGFALSGLGQAYWGVSQFAGMIADFPFLFLTAGVIPVLLVVHLRRGNREAGILLIPAILMSLTLYAYIVVVSIAQIPAFQAAATSASRLIFNIRVGPFFLSFEEVSDLLYVVSFAVIIVLRSTRISHKQAVLEGEIEAAREVQQVILPEQVEAVSGFTVESIYQPAQQVGGDFFQILPAGEGGLLVVIGDVAGKGLPAAMLVSVLVGAIRMVAEYSHDPAVVLAGLNQRLIGRTHGGFSTALAAHISADGLVTIANAGHLSPYLDGKEVELPGALPLGVAAGTRYETTQIHLAPSSRLTFYSDGVVEAQNEKRELFGFDRAKAISTQPAAAIVHAAKQFGQSDDITVVSVQRSAAIATAA